MNDHRLSDEDLTMLVERGAEGYFNARYASEYGNTWAELDGGSKNIIREQCLAYTFHATKALHELGYRKPRVITTRDELDALGWTATILDGNGVVWVNDGDSLDQWASLGERDPQGGPIWLGSADIGLPATVLYEPQS